MPNLGGAEWLMIILLIVLLFGAKRLPDAARGLGRSLRIFKAETKGLVDDTKAGYQEGAAPAAPQALPSAPVAPVVPAENVVPQPVQQAQPHIEQQH